MPSGRVLKVPSLKQVKRASRDNWLNRNQPKRPKRGEHPAADRLIDAIKERRDPNA